MIIYKATNLVNGKVYVGQTVNTLKYRKEQHWREAICPSRKNAHFHNALLKYGIDNFEIGAKAIQKSFVTALTML